MRSPRRLATLLLAGLLAIPFTSTTAQEEAKPYRLVDGKVDFNTYNGYRRYHDACHVCHGPDGLGSSFAPALLDSLKTLSYGDFANIVAAGRVGTLQGRPSVMPSFGANVDVMTYMADIYAYLKARSDGVIGRGRPKRLPKGQ